MSGSISEGLIRVTRMLQPHRTNPHLQEVAHDAPRGHDKLQKVSRPSNGLKSSRSSTTLPQKDTTHDHVQRSARAGSVGSVWGRSNVGSDDEAKRASCLGPSLSCSSQRGARLHTHALHIITPHIPTPPDVRAFAQLDLYNPACSAASPCSALPTYTDAVANSFTTNYMTGSAVAKAQGE